MFVALDEGPAHPRFPGAGFITIPELSWRRIETAHDAVRTGQRARAEFLQSGTRNLEARLPLRAAQPDPFHTFAGRTTVGQKLHGRITEPVPSGVFVQATDAIEVLVHLRELTSTPVASPPDAVRAGDDTTVAVTGIDRERRRPAPSRQQNPPPGHQSPSAGLSHANTSEHLNT
ncbi:S1 RNA-binding domain-containing protein [Streptomyces sp. NPDC059943]|uniref:S1 RNA-binding domain-containing protein n=1 Tax=Streptomyces sp. NPDC059943 TaxID=3347010 RepID=UPI00365F8313